MFHVEPGFDAEGLAVERYGDRLRGYVDFLSGAGIERGLIGPREAPRLWERHILNCAAVADVESGLIPEGSTVIDVGSGAGLPGLVWALIRPDLKVTLIESLQRRTDFLEEAVENLDLQSQVTVVRSRAEDQKGKLSANVVTARAVAPLEKLATWLVPLTAPHGQVLALKGETAETELATATKTLKRLRTGPAEVIKCGPWLPHQTTVVRIKIP